MQIFREVVLAPLGEVALAARKAADQAEFTR